MEMRAVHETIEAMEKIEESSRKVEELVSSINEIASQTNLLAINAAIEATKAGAIDFLDKPLSSERVLVTLRNALVSGLEI